MKLYGVRPGESTEDNGSPTRYANVHSKTRKKSRRKAHKRGRVNGKKQIASGW